MKYQLFIEVIIKAGLIKFATVLILLLGLANASDKLTNFYKEFKQGHYTSAIKIMEKLDGNHKFKGLKAYLLALCYKNLQQFEKANEQFFLAEKLGHKTDEFYFELGQSLYSANELEQAKTAFEKSYNQNYKKDSALYYLAYISELLEQHRATQKNYMAIIKDPKASTNLKQVSYFRLAELIYQFIKNKFEPEKYVARYVAPLLEKGMALDPHSETAADMQRRYDHILLEYNIHPLSMVNGRRLAKDGYGVQFTLRSGIDSNVSLANDQDSSTTSTLKSSLVYDARLFMNTRWIYKKRFVVLPEMQIFYTYYGDRVTPEVYQNDTYSLAPAIRTSYEHTLFKKRGSFLMDLEFNYTARDREQQQSMIFYGRIYSLIVGERIRLFKNGDSTFRFRYKDYSGYADSNTFVSKAFLFDQLWVNSLRHVMIYNVQLDFSQGKDDFYSTNSYMFRMDYLIPHLFASSWSFNMAGAVTLLDTLAQYDNRGLEKTYLASFKIQKRFGKHFRGALYYDFTSNNSLDSAYTYTKHVAGAELKLNF